MSNCVNTMRFMNDLA